jgi:DNA-binding Lrp family transcriptional regulator
LQHAEMDEARLLDAGDHLDFDACFLTGSSHEVVVVLRFPHCARGDRSNGRGFGLRDSSHVRERGDAPIDGVGSQALHVAGARAESHHHALPRHDIEAVVRRHARHDEVDRVGADVDRGQRRGSLDDPLVGHGADATLRPVVTAFVLINAEPARIAALAQQLSDLKGVGEVYSVAGDEDLVVIVRVDHHDDLAEVVTQRISALEGIMATRTLIAFQAYSKRDLEAMWSIGWE